MSPLGPAQSASRWLPVLVWMGVIFAFSHDAGSAERSGLFLRLLEAVWSLFGGGPPDPALAEALHLLIRKVGHMVEFAVLYALSWRAFGTGWRAPLALCVAYAVLDEWHQTFIPNRVGSPTDVLVDVAGAALAAAALAGRGLRSRVEPR